MTSRDQEFLERWQAEKRHYERWGDIVLQRLQALVSGRIAPIQAGTFFRIPPKVRLKEDNSLLLKAFYRPEKKYESPYDEIEDKVGLRLVLLLDEDVQLVAEALSTDTEIWTAIKARDYELERADRPYEFSYQSLHFVVRSKAGLKHADVEELPADLPCEIQIRTLLQHAHSEVTHDTLYKPSIQSTPEMKRAAAKSMALIEATGDYFSKLSALIADQVAPLQRADRSLESCYRDLVGNDASGRGTPLNNLVLDRYGNELDLVELETWLRDTERRYIGERIATHKQQSAAFSLPSILLVFFRVAHEPLTAPINSPLPESDLQIIYSDLGLSMNG